LKVLGSNLTESFNIADSTLACFCDCKYKSDVKLDKLKPHIKYESDSEENESNAESDITNIDCPCSCHGAYNLDNTLAAESSNKYLDNFLVSRLATSC
jgi:hypothetical protein